MAYAGVKYTNVPFHSRSADKMDREKYDQESYDMQYTEKGGEIDDPQEENTNLSRNKFWTGLRHHVVNVIYVILFLAFTAYVVLSLIYDARGAIFVCVVDILWFLLVIIHVFKVDLGKPCRKLQKLWLGTVTKGIRFKVRIVTTVVVCVGLVAFLIWDISSDAEKLKPLGGFALFIVLLWVTSTSPLKVNWLTVIWGILLQFGIGIIILRWPPGYAACRFVGDAVGTFLAYTDEGSKFVFGEKGYLLHAVAFQVLPVIVFFSAVVSVLYFLGVMQVVIRVIAAVLRLLMQTTPIESFATAAHIFIGQVESSAVLKPFLNELTSSELHAVLTSGFATVAGTVIAAYIEFGVPAEHVISASFMSAPAALAVAKLTFPETKETNIKMNKNFDLEVGKERNIMEAASTGAVTAIKLVASVVVNLIAFIAILAFLDAALSYFGSRVGHPELSFEFLCSYIFMPLAFVMGIPWSECGTVGKLIGKKIIINEFLAFADLGVLIKSGEIQDRSMVIATYILCGFGSIAAMGINLGALSSAEPRRKRDFAKLLLRAVVAGNIACFMTACVAGTLYQSLFVPLNISNTTNFNDTGLLNVTQNYNSTLNITTTRR